MVLRAKMILGVMLLALSASATAQLGGYNFLADVKARKAQEVMAALSEPGSTVVNTREGTTGDTALHIVTRGRDASWIGLLLFKGAQIDARNRAGETALAIAARLGFYEGAQLLVSRRASVDLSNAQGETPLILAVRNRDLATARLLLEAGADPKRKDSLSGFSARDYAAQDPRASAILKMIDSARPVTPRKSFGPAL